MKRLLRIATLVGVLALMAAPTMALATQPAEPGHGHGKANGPRTPQTGPKAPLPQKAKAYGRYCRQESKVHVAGTPGTPFSVCVTAMAKAAAHEDMSPGRACKGASGKHIAGEEGTSHSRCVAGVVELRKERREAEEAEES